MRSVHRIVATTRRRLRALVCVGLSLFGVAIVPSWSSAERAVGWTIVSSPNEEGYDWLQDVDAFNQDSAWSVGYYIDSEGVYEPLGLRWDGSAWSLVETPDVGPNGSWLYGVAAVSSSEAWAAGWIAGEPDTYTSTTLIEHWTGSAWSVVPSPNPSKDPIYGANQLYDVHAFAPDDVWAAGWQWAPVGSAPLIERWDGRRWRVSPTPDDQYRELRALDGTSSSDIWAVGQSLNVDDGYQSMAMHWDGSSWAVVPTPKLPYNNYLNDVAVVNPSDVWAVGFSLPPAQTSQPYVLHWDGSAWAVVSIAPTVLSSTYNSFQSVVAISANDVWAAGSQTIDGHEVVTLVERWDGTRWRIDPTPNLQDGGNYLNGLSLDRRGGLWAVGYFYPDDVSPFRTLVLRRPRA